MMNHCFKRYAIYHGGIRSEIGNYLTWSEHWVINLEIINIFVMWCNADLLCNCWIMPHMLCWLIWSLWITEAVDVWVKYFCIYLHNNQISTNHQAIKKCCLLCNNFLSFSRWDQYCIMVCPMNMDMVIVYFVWDILVVPRGFGKIGSVL